MPWSGLVGGSLWNVTVSTKTKICTVTVEEYQAPIDNRQLRLLQQLHIPGNGINGRVLSWPKVVCRQGNLLVAQIVTHKVDHMQFLVIDLVKQQCFVFTDTVKHFLRSYALLGSVECCLSPDLYMLMLRLPREVARSNASSLVLVGRTRFPAKPIMTDKNPVETTARSRIHDRRHNIMLFDPRFPRRLLSMHVNEFCTRCFMLSRDQDTDTTVLQKTCHFGQLSATQVTVADYLNSQTHDDGNDARSSDDSDEDDSNPLMIFKTVSCRAEYSRTADFLVLCCFVEASLQGGTYIRMFLFDSDTFMLISKCHKTLEVRDPTESVGAFQIVFSPCDTKVHIVVPGDDPGCVVCTMEISRAPSLQRSCRSAVLKTLSSSQDVSALPVPPSLKRYLNFQNNKFVDKVSQCDEE